MKFLKLNYYNVFLISFRFLTLFQGIYFLILKDIGNFFYCLFIFLITFLIDFIFKKTSLNLPLFFKFLIQFFIFLAMLIGHVNNMYSYIPIWDDILHFFSGFIISFLGYLIITNFLYKNNIKKHFKYFISFYIFIFGVAFSGIWEIYEFTVDSLFSLKSQNGSLNDTMIDIINGSIGPFLLAIVNILKPKIFINNKRL